MKNFGKKEREGIQGLPNFFGAPYYLRNGESYGFQILHAQLWAQSEQKPIKNSGKDSRVHCQRLLKIFRAPIHRAHRAVIFAIAQLSCLSYASHQQQQCPVHTADTTQLSSRFRVAPHRR